MATAHLWGAADVSYAGPSGTVTHLLAVPLMRVPGDGFELQTGRLRWESWNADGTDREVFVLGTEVQEVQATVRYENEPAALLELLRAGLEDDEVLTYRPHGAAGASYPVKLVAVVGSPSGRIRLKPDRVRWSLGEYEATLLLRRVDGGSLEGLL